MWNIMAGMEDKTGGAEEDTSEDDTGFSQNLALWKPCLLVMPSILEVVNKFKFIFIFP